VNLCGDLFCCAALDNALTCHIERSKKAGHNAMMIKRARAEKLERDPEYRLRGSRKLGVGLNTYQKTVMREARENLGISQATLGKRIAEMAGLQEPVSQAMISYLEKINPRGRKPALASEFLPLIEQILHLEKGFLAPKKDPSARLQAVQTATVEPAPTQAVGAGRTIDMRTGQADIQRAAITQDLPIYHSTLSQDGTITVSAEAGEFMARPGRLHSVRNGHGIRVSAGYGMEPVFEAGDVIFVHPNLSVVPNHYVVLRRQESGGEMLVRKLIAENATEWTVQQTSPEPKTYALPKAEWPIANPIIGKYYAYPM
jgi:phage repressor protein C with HTH and peptisase S24 domain